MKKLRIMPYHSGPGGRRVPYLLDGKLLMKVFPVGTPDDEITEALEAEAGISTEPETAPDESPIEAEKDAEERRLRRLAKAVGVKSYHNMKLPLLKKKIAAKQAENGNE